MDLIQAIVLGLVQGLAEFIPISSSAHLIIIPWLLGWKDPGLAFDVALHMGTLIAGAGLTDEERHKVFEANARRVYPRLHARLASEGR